MIIKGYLFSEGTHLSLSHGTQFISNSTGSIAKAIPVSDDQISLSTFLTKDDVKVISALLKQTGKPAHVRDITETTVTFTSRGIDVEVDLNPVDKREIDIRAVLRDFWKTKPKEAKPLNSGWLSALKRAVVFCSKDSYRLGEILSDGEHVVATDGHAMIVLDAAGPDLILPREEAVFLSKMAGGLFHETEDHYIFSSLRESVVLRKNDSSTFPPWEAAIPKDMEPLPFGKTIRSTIIDAGKFSSKLGEPTFSMTRKEGLITITACTKTRRFNKAGDDFEVLFDASKIKSEAKASTSLSFAGSVYKFGVPRGCVILMGLKKPCQDE